MQRNFIKQDELRTLPGARWRDFLKALAKPAERVHNYRRLTSDMVESTMSYLDCRQCNE